MSDKLEKDALRELIPQLPPNVVEVRAEYSGSGDSGQFDSVEFIDAANEAVTIADALKDEFETAFDGILEDAHGGWENEDGAQGTFTLNIGARMLEHEHTNFYTESDTETDEYEV
jgi:hypothetical protein